MKILITNDDGIDVPGIRKLAEMAVQLGEVIIIAPDHQCSAMSQQITLRRPYGFRNVDFPVAGVTAYSIGGTPADCVKIGLNHMKLRPDIVFSGMNYGHNMGYDIAYSGTVAAAMEAVMNGVPAIAFSNDFGDIYDAADKYMLDLTKELLAKPLPMNGIWNINFPGCPLEMLMGIKRDVKIGKIQYIQDNFVESYDENGELQLAEDGIRMDINEVPEGTDCWAVLHNYISIGFIKCNVLD